MTGEEQNSKKLSGLSSANNEGDKRSQKGCAVVTVEVVMDFKKAQNNRKQWKGRERERKSSEKDDAGLTVNRGKGNEEMKNAAICN